MVLRYRIKSLCSVCETFTGLQCCGSALTFWYGCGSSDPYLCLTDPDADPGGPKTYGSECGSGTLVKKS
jgi:hypothetical protein